MSCPFLVLPETRSRIRSTLTSCVRTDLYTHRLTASLGSMQNRREQQGGRPRSISRSPLSSPGDERDDPMSRTVAFVPFEIGTSSGVGKDTRRAVRVQAAKASAAARKRTIARKLAEKQAPTASDEPGTSSSSETGRKSRTSSTSGTDNDSLQITISRSPSRSLSATPTETTFRQYPVSRWHPLIPSIVDHFTRFFLPSATSSSPPTPAVESDGRQDLRNRLWPAALSDTCLFNAIMLVSASHATVSRALSIPVSLLGQLKHTTIESINDAIPKSDSKAIGDAVIAAIALVGGWELVSPALWLEV